MTLMTLTALFDARAEADRAAERLVSEVGIARSDVTVIAQEAGAAGSGVAEDTGFFGALRSLFMPDDDRDAYSEAIRRGGFLLTARVEEGSAERAMGILEEHGAVDLDERRQAWRAEGGWSGAGEAPSAAQALPGGTVVATGAADAAGGTPPAAAPRPAAPDTPSAAAARPAGAGGEETIALAEERLRVGKRPVEGGRVRVRSYVVETPVEERVTLRDERVSVERRAVDRAPTEADRASFDERTIEVAETAEEAVVSKEARVTEELVVGKSADEHVETVRDTVRRTEVEVDDDRRATGAGTAARPGTPAPQSGPADPGARR
jgi:uncharacterized protein (TIGR02271 family)